MLAGFAVGMGICEGADIGAIYSLYVAAAIVFQMFFFSGKFSWQRKNILRGGGTLALVCLCAALVAAQPLLELIATNIKGVVGTKQDSETKAAHWDFATQWSLPKAEVLSLFVPGLFGYRMDTPDGGNYWGRMGRAPEWDRYVANGQNGPVPTGLKRHAGGGCYAGVLVCLLAIWAAVQGFRPKNFVFSSSQRRWIWFWSATGVLSLLLAFGRFAPFYQWVYALPYFSTIRNPAKFLSLFSVALVVLFAYGGDGLWRVYLAADPDKTRSQLSWWGRLSGFDRKWFVGSLLVLGASLFAWFLYSAHENSLIHYLSSVQISDSVVEKVAEFSVRQIGWFVGFLALAIFLLTMITGRVFSKGHAATGAILIGLLLVVDLGRANQPWIVFFDYDKMYARDPITDFLQQKPFEHRVALFPVSLPPAQAALPPFYQQKWVNHVFPFYNIQAAEVVQLPRLPEDYAAFQNALTPKSDADAGRLLARTWQLTNVRYAIGPTMSPEMLNREFNFESPQFRVVERFEIVPEAGLAQASSAPKMTARASTAGRYALWEFAGALPRTKLYSYWQNDTNDQDVLTQLASADFNPANLVLVDGPLPANDAPATAFQEPGTVEFASYAPKEIDLKTEATNASVLLLNDRYEGNWKVRVDGVAATLLRCNYIMRGVYLTAGNHNVDFRFEPPTWPLYLTLLGIGISIAIVTRLFLASRKNVKGGSDVSMKLKSPKILSKTVTAIPQNRGKAKKRPLHPQPGG
jgi:hypothetical protein